jgi:hypothetical protein
VYELLAAGDDPMAGVSEIATTTHDGSTKHLDRQWPGHESPVVAKMKRLWIFDLGEILLSLH